MSETSLAESAQVIFCSIADSLSPANMDKVLNTDSKKGYPTIEDIEKANKKIIDNAI